MNNVHIYGVYGFETGVLGWILEQSPTYISNNFKFNAESTEDPWDNHTDDPNHWSHKWIEIQETAGVDTSQLDELMAAHGTPSVVGISYGAWMNNDWDAPTTIKIGIQATDRVFDAWWQAYATRTISDVRESIDMHIHDHRQDDPEYRKYMYHYFGEYAEMESVSFWKLQTAFHWEWKTIATDEDEEAARLYAKQTFPRYPADIMVDIMNLDLQDLCKKLGCEYAPGMQEQYDLYLDYCENVLNV